ncbi:MAG: hypothetical protein KAQ92_03310 [Candidatus Aenigmarchaeota archaeon]|nr:hypothetical protein [Candidatus Aenigmarchaeota archaeon]
MIGKKIIKIDKNLNNSIIFEGQKSAKAVYCLAQKDQVNAPIAGFVDDCLNNQVNVRTTA